MGAAHAAMLARDIRGSAVRAVYDADLPRARQVAAMTGATVAPSTDALIAADGIDAVVVASPDRTHAALVARCLRAGKPVLGTRATSAAGAPAAGFLELGHAWAIPR